MRHLKVAVSELAAEGGCGKERDGSSRHSLALAVALADRVVMEGWTAVFTWRPRKDYRGRGNHPALVAGTYYG